MLCTAELQKQHKDMDSSLEHFCKEQTTALQELCLVRCVSIAGALHDAYSLSSRVTDLDTHLRDGLASAASLILHTFSTAPKGCA